MTLATVPAVTDKRELALLKAVGLDRVSSEQRELALNIAQRYELDLLLKHLVLIDGRPYITRDGLLHVAHRHGALDGIVTTEPSLVDGYWRASCSVFRKDMSHPFTYSGRYPEKGQNAKFAPEMAVKVAEVMALRRAFDVAAPAAEERWDTEVPVVDPAPKPSLAEVAAGKRNHIYREQAERTPAAHVAEMVDAIEEREASEAESIPAFPEPTAKPLTAKEFKTRLNTSSHTVDEAEAAFHRVFPNTPSLAALTDEERGFLWLAVTDE